MTTWQIKIDVKITTVLLKLLEDQTEEVGINQDSLQKMIYNIFVYRCALIHFI